MGTHRKQVVSASARRAVDSVLAVLTQPGGRIEDFVATAREVDKLPDERNCALAERLSDKDAAKRAAAAALLLSIASQEPEKSLGRTVEEKAKKIVISALKKGSPDEQRLTCMLLAMGSQLPRGVVAPLRALLSRTDEWLRLSAAAALASCGCARLEELEVLRLALIGENKTAKALAASAFVRAGVRLDTVDQLFAALQDVDAESQYGILLHLRLSGPAAVAALPHLARIIGDEKRHYAVRRAAVAAVASVARDAQSATDVLLQALQAKEWQVVTAAIGAFSELGGVPDAAQRPLQKHLGSRDAELRSAGARGLATMGLRAAGATAALIKHGRAEHDIYVMEEMSAALAAIGPSAIPQLIGLLKGVDVKEHVLARNALIKMSGNAAPALAEALLAEPDRRFRLTILTILALIWEDAAPAVPALSIVLDETSDDDSARCALIALFAIGRPALSAAPALIRHLIGPNEELASCAEQVLLKIGGGTVPALKKAAGDLSGEKLVRVEDLAFRLETGLEARLRRLASVNPKVLETFVAAADILIAKGSISLIKVAELIRSKIKNKELQGEAFRSFSQSTLIGRIKLLTERVGFRLIDNQVRKKGGLTEQAKLLLPDAKAVLRWRDATRGMS